MLKFEDQEWKSQVTAKLSPNVYNLQAYFSVPSCNIALGKGCTVLLHINDARKLQSAGLLDSAIITPESMVWAEGQEAWLPLQDIADLYAEVYHISATGSSHIPATSSDHAAGRFTVYSKSSVQTRLACCLDNLPGGL